MEKPPISKVARLKIHQDAYLIRLSESIKDDFARVQQEIDESHFHRLIKDFISKHPSQSLNLAEHSKKFVDYIKTEAPDLYLFALKDWMQILSEYAANATDTVSPQEIQAGHGFHLALCPTTVVRDCNDTTLIAYQNQEQMCFAFLAPLESQIFARIEKDGSLENLVAYAEDISLPLQELQQHITNWLKDNIIYCKGVSS